MNNQEVCGTCKYNRRDRQTGEFYCGNESGDNYAVPTFYDDTCDEWEEKE